MHSHFQIMRELTTNDYKPQGTIWTLNPIPIGICVEVHRRRFIGRDDIRHPPSTNMGNIKNLFDLVKYLDKFLHDKTPSTYPTCTKCELFTKKTL